MAKRTRTTTSVSTLVTDLNYLQDIARVAGRKDLQSAINEIAIDVNEVVTGYNKVRADINALKAAMLSGAAVTEEEEEEE